MKPCREAVESYCYEDNGKQMAEDRHSFRVRLKTKRSFELDSVVLDRVLFNDTEYENLPEDIQSKWKELYAMNDEQLKKTVMRRMCSWILNNPDEASKIFDLDILESSLNRY